MHGYITRAHLVLALLLLIVTNAASAAAIYYVAEDIADITPGEDLWSYSYFVRGYSFQADEGFTTIFDRTRVPKLREPEPPPGWATMVLQPDLGLPDDGAYDALAIGDNASTAQPFLVQFTFAGPGTPGSQPFTINRFVDGNYQQLDSGFTQRLPDEAIPEPRSLLLVVSGLSLALLQKHITTSR